MHNPPIVTDHCVPALTHGLIAAIPFQEQNIASAFTPVWTTCSFFLLLLLYQMQEWAQRVPAISTSVNGAILCEFTSARREHLEIWVTTASESCSRWAWGESRLGEWWDVTRGSQWVTLWNKGDLLVKIHFYQQCSQMKKEILSSIQAFVLLMWHFVTSQRVLITCCSSRCGATLHAWSLSPSGCVNVQESINYLDFFLFFFLEGGCRQRPNTLFSRDLFRVALVAALLE